MGRPSVASFSEKHYSADARWHELSDPQRHFLLHRGTRSAGAHAATGRREVAADLVKAVRCQSPQRDSGAPVVGNFSRFFFNDTPPTEIYTLSLHDALPI